MARHRPWQSVLLVAVLAAACQPVPGGAPVGTAKSNRRPVPATTGGPAPTPAPAEPEAGEEATASPEATATATATPAPTPTPTPASPLSAANRVIAESVLGGLYAAARLGFVNGRGELVSNNGGGIIGNNGVGLISENAAGLISKVKLISDRGAGYRLLDAAGNVSLTPLSGELTFADRRWVDGSATHHFIKDFAATDDHIRRVEVRPTGKLDYEFQEIVLERHPNGVGKRYDKARTSFFEDGRFMAYYHYTEVDDDAGRVLTLALVENESKFQDTLTGAALEMQRFSVDLTARTGEFRYRFPQLGLTETGTLVNVSRDASGRVALSYDDPLAFYDGTSRVTDEAGTLLYTKSQTTSGGVVTREYVMPGGAKLVLVRESGTLYRGRLESEGAKVADARMDRRTDGSVTFTLTFPEAPEAPIVIGYGLSDAQPASPFQRPATWRVRTVAGGQTAGYADGTAGTARFSDLRGVAASRVTPGRLYAADASNHRIRRVDIGANGAVTVTTYAGSGVQGAANGPRATATFSHPFGLAVGADDTLYVSEETGRRIRVVPPSGDTRTLAGTGVTGYQDGAGTAAQFGRPLGLALSPDGARLYVADYDNHVIRVVNTADGVVDTYAGTGVAGFANGALAAAQFNLPMALAFDSQGRLLVADRANRMIRAIAAGTVGTAAGSGVRERAYLDGPALQGGFNPPFSIAVGAGDQVFFARSDVRFLADGLIKSYAGGTTASYVDGTIHEARFGDLFGMTFGSDGRLYVTDSHAIRTVVPPTP